MKRKSKTILLWLLGAVCLLLCSAASLLGMQPKEALAAPILPATTEYTVRFASSNYGEEDAVRMDLQEDGTYYAVVHTQATSLAIFNAEGIRCSNISEVYYGTYNVTYYPDRHEVDAAFVPFFFLLRSNDYQIDPDAQFWTPDGLTYYYTIEIKGSDAFRVLGGNKYWDSPLYLLGNGVNYIAFDSVTGIADVFVDYRKCYLKLDYKDDDGNLIETKKVPMDTENGINYTCDLRTAKVSVSVLDWYDEQIYTRRTELPAGEYVIYYDAINNILTYDATEYRLLMESGDYSDAASRLLETEDGYTYTATWIGKQDSFVVTDGDYEWTAADGSDYLLEAGKTEITFYPETGLVELNPVYYYVYLKSDDYQKLERNRLTTEDGVEYTLTLVTGNTSFFVEGDATRWTNGDDPFLLHFGINTITFYPARSDQYVVIEWQELEEEYTTITISTAEELLSYASASMDADAFRWVVLSLSNNIDLKNTEIYFRSFGGIFEGNGYTLLNYEPSFYGSDYGFFRYLQSTAIVRDLTIECVLHAEGSQEEIGIFAGENNGRLENCTARGVLSGLREIGGIAGKNGEDGVIENCVNYATVTGEFRTGGIAGYNLGTVSGSENYGEINYADKQSNENSNLLYTGGIVGHNGGTILACVNYGTAGYEGIGRVTGGIAGGNLASVSECANYGSIYALHDAGGIVGVYGAIGESEGDLYDYIQDVWDRFNEEEDLENEEEEEENTDESTADAYLGFSYNAGAVTVDSNGGGIAGRITDTSTNQNSGVTDLEDIASSAAVDSEEVVEDDSDDSAEEQKNDRLIEGCISSGIVVVAKEYAGGLFGSMNYGEVRDCIFNGVVNAPDADYVGGIVGNGVAGEINYCAAFGLISGNSYVGGICGSGNRIYNCYSVVTILSGEESEKLGNIAGVVNDAEYNYYVGAVGGIDGIDYRYQAKRIEESALAQVGDLPEDLFGFSESHWYAQSGAYPRLTLFSTAELQRYSGLREIAEYYTERLCQVVFLDEDDAVCAVRYVPYGEALTELPVPPEQEDTVVTWEEYDFSCIRQNIVVYAVYSDMLYSLADNEAMPIFFVEGVFYPDSVLTVQSLPIPDIEGVAISRSLTYSISGESVGESTVVRVRAEDGENAAFILLDGVWTKAEATRIGSFLCFETKGAVCVAIGTEESSILSNPLFYGVLIAVAIVLIVAIVVIVVRRKKRN